MLRYISYVAVFLLAGTHLRAGELDAEFGAAAPAPSAALKAKVATDAATPPLLAASRVDGAGAWKASELDAESPSQAWGHFGGFHHGFGGFGHRGFGFGGFGHRGFGF